MTQENSRWKRMDWRLIAIVGLVVAVLLLVTSGVLAYAGGWNAWFDRGPAVSDEVIQPALGQESLPAAPQLDGAAPLDGGGPLGGGSGCERERMDQLPQDLD